MYKLSYSYILDYLPFLLMKDVAKLHFLDEKQTKSIFFLKKSFISLR